MNSSARRPRRGRRFAAFTALGVAAGLAIASLAVPAAARADEPTWAPVSPAGAQAELGLKADAEVSAFDVDLGSVLGGSPSRLLSARMIAPTVAPALPVHVSLPDPTGSFVDFLVQPVSVMEDTLAARHPDLQSYAGHAADNPTVTVRLSLTPLGLSASVRSGDNSSSAWYIDPVPSDAGASHPTHVSYGRGAASHRKADAQFAEPDVEAPVIDREPPAATTKVQRQIIRLALASDPSYANFYGTENVLAAKVQMITRVAQIYNDDLGVQLKLVDDTEKLNFDSDAAAYEPGGACGDQACYPQGVLGECSEDALRSNAGMLERVIGKDNYDVGHLSLGSGVGGMAYWNVVGVDYWKGGGCTGLANPNGDVFATDYVAHELGHQFGGSHTMNACHNSQDDSASEPGSASSIMGYAGLCGANDLQSNSDPYFSSFSIDQMHYWTGWAGVHEESANSTPQVTAPASKTIPIRTPFELTAQGSDPDGDALTYVWEQNNRGDFMRPLRDPAKVNGPLFRNFSRAADLTYEQAHSYYSGAHNAAGPNPSRTFPDMEQILRGTTNAHTGLCDGLDWGDERDCYSEFLPTAAYEGNGTGGIDFRVTARDLRVDGGGVGMASLHLDIDRSAGPFEVTSFATPGGTAVGGRAQQITWAVNGTDAPALAPQVRILLSLDGGTTFDRVLAESTANDGAETVTLPNVPAAKARIKIEAVDNYFFAVNGADFEIFDTALEALQPQAVRTVPGVPVDLPATVVPVYGGQPGDAVAVTWDTTGLTWDKPGSYRLLGSGVDTYGNAFSTAVLTVEIGDFSSTDPVSVTVPAGYGLRWLPGLLPAAVPAQVGQGESRFPTAVTWDTSALTQASLDTVGSVRISGTAAPAIAGAAGLPAQLTVLVTPAEPLNVAPDSTQRSATYTEPGYSIDGTVNGVMDDKAWSNWKGGGADPEDTLTYTWATPQLLDAVVLTAYRDGDATWPSQVVVSYIDAVTGERVSTAPVPVDASGDSPVARIDLSVDGHPVATSSIDVQMTANPGWWMAISEVQAFTRVATPANMATLARLNVDGTPVAGFDPATTRYDTTVDGSRWPIVSAVASDDEATVAVGAVDPATGRVPVVVTSADGTATTTYEVVVARRATFLTAPRLTLTGTTVTLSATVDPADAALQVEWFRNGVAQPQTGAIYTLSSADAGTSLTARVTATRDGFGSAQSTSAPLDIAAGGTGGGNTGGGNDGGGNGGNGGGTDGSGSSGSSPGGSGTTAGSSATTGITSTAATSGSRLGATGSTPATPVLVLGALLTALGAGVLIVRRRQRHRADTSSDID